MKNLILGTSLLILITNCNKDISKEIPDEVIVIVELIKNKNKSQEELKKFTKRYSDYDSNSAPNGLENIHQELESSDAFVIVSAEYNHFMPPALVNLLNHFYAEYQRKPSAVATYSVSPFGGVRVSSPLRSFLAQLGMPPISSMIHAPFVNKNFNNEGERISEDKDERQKEFIKFAEEIEWYANALKTARNK